MATEKIMVGIDNQVVELKGADKEAYISQRTIDQETTSLLETEYAAKQAARTSALTKLATIAGLTEEEMTSLGL